MSRPDAWQRWQRQAPVSAFRLRLRCAASCFTPAQAGSGQRKRRSRPDGALPARGSWLSKQIAGRNRALVTCALVGIAGSFIGFHLAILLELLKYGSIALFIAAAAGAVLVLWGWKAVRG